MYSTETVCRELPFSQYRTQMFQRTDVGMTRKSSEVINHVGASQSNMSSDRRYQRKHRRSSNEEACSAKRRKVMGEVVRLSCQTPWQQDGNAWVLEASHTPQQALQLDSNPHNSTMPELRGACYKPIVQESEVTSMEVEARDCTEQLEAAHWQLQEIEERITLEDDDEDDFELEPAERRPILVMSDSLKEGLQNGIGDIIPQTIVQSVNQSCMELVLWRPLKILPKTLNDSMQRLKHQSAYSSKELLVKSTDTEVQQKGGYNNLRPQTSPEEDMEL
ncbi:coiled-coil domain-containing protein 117 [Amia ocellicauda]|uniref:coiled-coil domain-containing protein 117 n=1 Tax=Amia ocellicauda TaxID=2972642 RepID=UPI0034643D67